ncbi:MAG TPA: hypothetical protein VD886_15730 [Herpetosiphonaceae bacterium]|nr:hypothetical protein [Herpetosiphonaceae bacterium]
MRILLADDHAVVRAGLATLIASQPDLLLVDIALPDQNGIQVTAEVCQA